MKVKRNAIETRAADKQMNYKQLAAAAGVNQKTIHAARSGAEIRTDTAGRIAAALGIPITEIIERADNE